MKNTLPLIVATILGLLAVFAVSRTMSRQSADKAGKGPEVLVANGNLKAGDVIAAENFRPLSVPTTYLRLRIETYANICYNTRHENEEEHD